MPTKIITEKDTPNIIKDYLNFLSLRELQIKYRTSEMMIKRILKENSIHIRSLSESTKVFSVNENYFEKIDTEEKAYYLGLIAADGNVSKNLNQFEIGLSGEEELQLLKRMKESIEYTGGLYQRKRKNKPTHKEAYRLSIRSKKFIKNLMEKGIFPNKSLTLKFPTFDQVPEHLIRHFIRGYVDGDGTINFKKNKSLNVGMLCSNSFYKDLNKVLKKFLGFEFGFYKRSNNTEVKVAGVVKPSAFCEWIYADSTIFLNRKYKNYKNFINFKEKDNAEKFLHSVEFKKLKEENEKLGIYTIKTELSNEEQNQINEMISQFFSKRKICRKMNMSMTKLDNFLKITNRISTYRTRKMFIESFK